MRLNFYKGVKGRKYEEDNRVHRINGILAIVTTHDDRISQFCDKIIAV